MIRLPVISMALRLSLATIVSSLSVLRILPESCSWSIPLISPLMSALTVCLGGLQTISMSSQSSRAMISSISPQGSLPSRSSASGWAAILHSAIPSPVASAASSTPRSTTVLTTPTSCFSLLRLTPPDPSRHNSSRHPSRGWRLVSLKYPARFAFIYLYHLKYLPMVMVRVALR